DKYLCNEIQEIKKNGWIDRAYSCSNIQRKIEKDWKMVYLCREHLQTNRILSWTIQLKPEKEKFYQFHQITIQCTSKAFDQYTQIICQLQIDDKQIIHLS
ncbi:unnamed protein product, partial [Adineta steineri]